MPHLFFTWLLASSSTALACSCFVHSNALKALNQADVVFVGKLVSRTQTKTPGVREARFQIEESFKGPKDAAILQYSSDLCKTRFRKGRMLIIGHQRGAIASVGPCGVFSASKEAEFIKRLREVAR